MIRVTIDRDLGTPPVLFLPFVSGARPGEHGVLSELKILAEMSKVSSIRYYRDPSKRHFLSVYIIASQVDHVDAPCGRCNSVLGADVI